MHTFIQNRSTLYSKIINNTKLLYTFAPHTSHYMPDLCACTQADAVSDDSDDSGSDSPAAPSTDANIAEARGTEAESVAVAVDSADAGTVAPTAPAPAAAAAPANTQTPAESGDDDNDDDGSDVMPHVAERDSAAVSHSGDVMPTTTQGPAHKRSHSRAEGKPRKASEGSGSRGSGSVSA